MMKSWKVASRIHTARLLKYVWPFSTSWKKELNLVEKNFWSNTVDLLLLHDDFYVTPSSVFALWVKIPMEKIACLNYITLSLLSRIKKEEKEESLSP